VTDQDVEAADSVAAREEFDFLVARAREGDREALPRLREYLDRNPEIWEQAGDIARHARDSWIRMIAGQDLAATEVFARKADALRTELAGADPTPLERLLVERVVATWLQVHHADAMVAQAGNVSLRQADFARKRQDSAHRRYLTAIGALVTVRRLLPARLETDAATASTDSTAAMQTLADEEARIPLIGRENSISEAMGDGARESRNKRLRSLSMRSPAEQAG
jgi:hypothetical protein